MGPSVNHQFVNKQALYRPKELSALRYVEMQMPFISLKYRSEVSELKLGVINAWINLWGAWQIVHVYDRPLQLMQAAAKQERARYEQGDSTKEAAIEAYAQYENSISTHRQSVAALIVKQSVIEKLTMISAADWVGTKLAFDTLPVFSEVDKTLNSNNYQDTSFELQMTKM